MSGKPVRDRTSNVRLAGYQVDPFAGVRYSPPRQTRSQRRQQAEQQSPGLGGAASAGAGQQSPGLGGAISAGAGQQSPGLGAVSAGAGRQSPGLKTSYLVVKSCFKAKFHRQAIIKITT